MKFAAMSSGLTDINHSLSHSVLDANLNHSPSMLTPDPQYLSRTYASVCVGPKGNASLQGIASSSSCNGVNRLVRDGLPRMTHVKGLDNPTSVMKGPAGSQSLLKS
jgi:hypothetical protein